MAMPTFVAAGAKATATTGNLAVPLPTGWQPGDIFFCVVQSSNQAISAPSGWTEVGNQASQALGTAATALACRLAVFWRRARLGDLAPTVPATTNHLVGAVVAYRGCIKTGNPWQAVGGGAVSGGAYVPNTTIGCTATDQLPVGFFAHSVDSNTQTFNWASGCGADATYWFTARADFSYNGGTGGGVGAGDYPAGMPVGNHTMTVGTTGNPSNNHAGVFLYLLPEPVRAWPSFVAAGAAVTAAGNVTPPLPSGWAQNDILLLVCQTSNQTVNAPSGYTQLDDQTRMGTGTAATLLSTRLAVFWKRAGASESAPTITFTGDHIIAQISAFRGCETNGNPWSTVGTGNHGAAQSTGCPWDTGTTQWVDGVSQAGTYTFTVPVANCLILHIGAHGTDTATWANMATQGALLTGYMEYSGASTVTGTGGGFGICGGALPVAGDAGNNGAGFTNMLNCTWQGGGTAKSGLMILALKPPVVVPTIEGGTGTFTESGSVAGLLESELLVGSLGSFALAGASAFLSKLRAMPVASGSFTEAGNAAALLRGRLAVTVPGNYAESGSAAGIIVRRAMRGSTGTFTETGSPAELTKIAAALVYMLAGLSGSFNEAGNAARLLRRALAAGGTGSFALSGNSARLLRALISASGTGSFTEAGAAARMMRRLLGVSGTGNYAEAGNTARLLAARRLAASVGTFIETGNPAELTKISLALVYYLAGLTGVYNEAGAAARLLGRRQAVGGTGSFAAAGSAARLLAARRMAGSRGTFTHAGGAAGAVVRRLLGAGTGTFAESGAAARLLRACKLVLNTGTFTEAGAAARLQFARLLAGGKGIFIETGSSAFLFIDFPAEHNLLVAGTGVFLEAGSSASLLARRMLAASKGTFTETGSAARLLRALKAAGQTGAYTEAGGSAALFRLLRLAAGKGTFNEAGASAFLLRRFPLAASGGTFTESGAAARLLGRRLIIGSRGVFTESGSPAGMQRTRPLAASGGVFIESGAAAKLVRARMLPGVEGIFRLFGDDAELTHGGFIIFADEDICWVALQLALAVEVTPEIADACDVRMPLATAVNVQPVFEHSSEIHLPLTTMIEVQP